VIENGDAAVVFTVVEGEPIGAKLLVRADGTTVGDGPAALAKEVPELLAWGRSRIVEHEGRRFFADVVAPPPRLLVFGAVDTAEALCAAAKQLGWTAIVADARSRFATRERLPSADEIIVAWPADVITQVQPDARTAVVVLAEAELDRIAGPCGLDIGAESSPETAISILAEMLATKAGRDGGRLRDAAGSIHVEPPELSVRA
jgi:xanthine dehydrogenase accessory factor